MEKRKGLVIGVSGRARVGKDIFAKYLIDVFSNEHNREFKTTAFAYRLKQMCLEHFNLNRDQLWGDRKEEQTKFGKTEIGDLGLSSNPNDYWTPREIMQEIGSFYRKIDHDFWVRKVDEKWGYNDCPDLVITDVRYIDECEYVKKHGILIKIIKKGADKIHGMDHESEIFLDDKPDNYFDIMINNDGTLEDLYTAAYNAAKAILTIEKIRIFGVFSNEYKGRSYDG